MHGLVDAHAHLTFAAHGTDPAAVGSREIQRIHLEQQAAAGVVLVRDCGATPGAAPPPSDEGLPVVIRCGPMLGPDIPFLSKLRRPVPESELVDTAVALVGDGHSWVKLLADAPGEDGNMLAATPTYGFETVAQMCDAVHTAGGRVAAHCTGRSVDELVDCGVDSVEHGGWLDSAALARLGKRGGAWTPTLSTALLHLSPMIEGGHPAAPMLQAHLDHIAATLPLAPGAGVVLLAGTDETPHGSVAQEVELLQKFGLSHDHATQAAGDTAASYLSRT